MIDKENGTALSNVSITAKDKNSIVRSRINGDFEVSKSGVYTFIKVGYQDKTIELQGDQFQIVQLDVNPTVAFAIAMGTSNSGAYGDYIHDLDHSVSEIIEALEYSGVLDNTVLVFTSDNGGNIGDIEEKEARKLGLENNGVFRGDKHTIWEGGFRVPLIVRWPGKIKEGTVSDRMVNVVDIFSTIQELVSGEVLPPKEAAHDSFSFYDELIGKRSNKAMRSTMVVNSVTGVMAVRKGPWKYIEGIAAAPLKEGARKYLSAQLTPQLYNLEKDISETENIINTEGSIHEDLQRTLNEIKSLQSERLLKVYRI